MGYGPSRPGRVPVWVKPPAAAKTIARRALKDRAELPRSRRGGLEREEAEAQGITSGVHRAESIARGDMQPAQDIRDFFARFRGTHAVALAKGKEWGRSKVQQSWDLWGGEPMWLAAREALAKAGQSPGPEPNPAGEHLTRKTYEGRAGDERHITATEEGHVDPRRLVDLPGARGEHNLFRRSPTGAKTPEDWADFVESVRNEGVREQVFIVVEPRTRSRGRLTIYAGPQIHEGNHRIRAAVAAGIETVPVLIRYFGKAEDRWTVAPGVPRQAEGNPLSPAQARAKDRALAWPL